jgi:hypothetical protein
VQAPHEAPASTLAHTRAVLDRIDSAVVADVLTCLKYALSRPCLVPEFSKKRTGQTLLLDRRRNAPATFYSALDREVS